MAPTITFHGAAQTVTGSKHLIEHNNKQILVDCGMFQGQRELRDLNWEPFQFDPLSLDAVVITHAHTDHIGMLPKLRKDGYRGPIYATKATIGLCKISLPDGGRLQEEDARYHNKHRISRHEPALPLFTEADAYEVLKQFKPVHFFDFQELPGGMQLRYVPAGHILGSAMAEIYFDNGERILMGGDLGRYDHPILVDPFKAEFAEYLVVESTYGDRLHEEEDSQAVLEKLLWEVYERRSCLIVPSFAIGRTQELLWHCNNLAKIGRLPDLPIYVDSPMATSTTLLFTEPYDDMDPDLKVDLRGGHSPFAQDLVKFVKDRNMSKALNDQDGPMMVISGSGMCNGGRVIHHLKRRLPGEDNIVLFTGYQGEGTLGRKILEGAPEVEIHQDMIPVRCQIEKVTGMSAHGDQNEIMRFLGGFKTPPKKTFMVHGEPLAQSVLAGRMRSDLGWNVEIPARHDSFELV